jgi:hypothetical protein
VGPLELCHRGFEFHYRHGFLSAFIGVVLLEVDFDPYRMTEKIRKSGKNSLEVPRFKDSRSCYVIVVTLSVFTCTPLSLQYLPLLLFCFHSPQTNLKNRHLRMLFFWALKPSSFAGGLGGGGIPQVSHLLTL